mmetsp:Transcript_18742/g.58909  ORF Transcript_18742/g.58909 Transcript_18742/m.58909 type:complete len:269 (+) Transcript_18742:1135-1941(+)
MGLRQRRARGARAAAVPGQLGRAVPAHVLHRVAALVRAPRRPAPVRDAGRRVARAEPRHRERRHGRAGPRAVPYPLHHQPQVHLAAQPGRVATRDLELLCPARARGPARRQQEEGRLLRTGRPRRPGRRRLGGEAGGAHARIVGLQLGAGVLRHYRGMGAASRRRHSLPQQRPGPLRGGPGGQLPLRGRWRRWPLRHGRGRLRMPGPSGQQRFVGGLCLGQPLLHAAPVLRPAGLRRRQRSLRGRGREKAAHRGRGRQGGRREVCRPR